MGTDQPESVRIIDMVRRVDRRCLILGAIAVIHVLVGVMLDLGLLGGRGNDLVQIVFYSFVPCQGSFLGFWAAFGGKASPWRFVIAVVFAVAWCWSGIGPRDGWLWSFIRLDLMFLVGSLLLGLRFVGLGLSRGDTCLSSDKRYRIQFSLRSMLGYTTAIAILLGLFHYLPQQFLTTAGRMHTEADVAPVFGLIVGAGVFIAVVSLWISMSQPSMVLRIVVPIVVAGVCTVMAELILPEHERWALALLFYCQTILLIASVWPVRLAGYRLIWRRR
ncbi:MAG: hypothetical protein V3R99_05580, partial [Thermoguttaceae bacterium]